MSCRILTSFACHLLSTISCFCFASCVLLATTNLQADADPDPLFFECFSGCGVCAAGATGGCPGTPSECASSCECVAAECSKK
jgi:hypothetical protein